MAGSRPGGDCRADFDCSVQRTADDIFIFPSAWFNRDPRSDANGVSGRTIDDLPVFLNLWFAGC